MIALTTVVSTGRGGTATFNSLGGVQTYSLLDRDALAGKTVRLVAQVPWGGTPPYRLSVMTETVRGLRSRYVKLALRCPEGGKCLSGGEPGLQGLPSPRPATRGLTPASLTRSLRHVVDGEPTWVKPIGVHCASTAACEVVFRDDGVGATLRVGYDVEGEQRAGCWLAMASTRRRITPRDAQIISPAAADRIGGCADWVK